MAYQSAKRQNQTQQSKHESLETEKSTSLSGTFSSLAKDTARQTADSFKDIGKGLFEQLMNSDSISEQYPDFRKEVKKDAKSAMNLERGTLFSFRKVEEDRQIEEIKELIQAIRREVQGIKQADAPLMREVKDIERLTIDSMPEQMGIYHVRFLEIVLKVLQSLRLKIGESNTWMQALVNKKAKRGSAFAANSKKQGTQYSLSQEHQVSRNVQ
ncbi:hypothetical protein COU87_03900 [Candidatus Roizmanbacteria bacterium CG10_big_fil_rev_8_21_14_0_10_39_12]|uniref:DUF5660 domain-containing protein n=1 Tax=Candidatus Roizmanbacteria bacterium CG10_big_fil_rev_8_21_14_0_10_39_12 TaxID=1974852 RepID=A0A2M8KNT7_9BACT|nr:MAG: hypothetical protein COY15_01920 [Candidatus Roizmanbacteria bacterium CG_4_10_14_0_2_um_filter_39_12]PJE61570.1 MAG: hypothetical protein COU87_03900 [Candidatus Roizmanbacteria bacterium CG10_big_fil_rev_8_21_14_0_10_39_12]